MFNVAPDYCPTEKQAVVGSALAQKPQIAMMVTLANTRTWTIQPCLHAQARLDLPRSSLHLHSTSDPLTIICHIWLISSIHPRRLFLIFPFKTKMSIHTFKFQLYCSLLNFLVVLRLESESGYRDIMVAPYCISLRLNLMNDKIRSKEFSADGSYSHVVSLRMVVIRSGLPANGCHPLA